MGSRRGRAGRPWRRLVAQVRARHEACCRCWQPIDYSLQWPDPMSFSVDHYPEPLSKRPDLAHDPSNLHAAHLVHNEQAGNREEAPEVGATSRTW